jgi:predicted transcriptional regulator of viral defense system
MPTVAYRALYSLAQGQMGYVTTAQATAIGVRPMTLVMMKKRGALERRNRGLYRLIDFPIQPLERYMCATLWPYNRAGVLSHETALFLHSLHDIEIPQIHVTVPVDFRIQRNIPDSLVIHHRQIIAEEVTRFEGMLITTPQRAIYDCIQDRVDTTLLTRCVDRARRSGLIGASIAGSLRKEISIASFNSDIGENSQSRAEELGSLRSSQ